MDKPFSLTLPVLTVKITLQNCPRWEYTCHVKMTNGGHTMSEPLYQVDYTGGVIFITNFALYTRFLSKIPAFVTVHSSKQMATKLSPVSTL